MDEIEQDGFHDSAVAIVGLACHVPGALNIDEFWDNLKNGVESIKFFTDEELLANGETAKNLSDPNYVRAQPYLENYDRFDAGFWGFSPQDAAVTDPAHRLFLEVAYQALEHSGHTGYDSEGSVGVFAGSGASLYWMDNLKSNPQLIEDMGEFLVRHTGNDMNFLATRFSYELDLRGPSINVQTACSSALVSVHMAIQSLNGGECDMALAGGSTVLLPQGRGYLYRDGEIMSPDGHCRPFDAKSAGTIFGSGAGAVVLKRLADAVDDGDTIYAVIRGSAINNDGSQKVGFLAPGVEGQAGAVAEALAVSETSADEVSYIETHGTGTNVGDPIEFEALNQVYRRGTDKRNYCGLGSVKSNIGHLGEAAGAVALIKVILSLQNQKIPASLNYESPNPQLDLSDSPFYINNKLTDWSSFGPRIAAVTALGAGGTNAHVIVEEAPEVEPGDESQHACHLLTISTKTESALDLALRNLSEHVKKNVDQDLADIAYTLNVGRRNYRHRAALSVESKEALLSILDAADTKAIVKEKAPDSSSSLVFMLPGGGAQYSGMGVDLYHSEEVYRNAFDQCIECLPKAFGEEVRALVFADKAQREQATVSLQMPTFTLTSLFACEYALAKQFEAWGAKPDAMIGHSMGENTAACLAGVFSLHDAMNLVYIRGQIFEKAPEGGMLSISLPLSQARQYMLDELDVAAINSPDLCVATGGKDALSTLQSRLEDAGVDCSIVRINVAAHSRMLDDVLEEFRAYLHSIKLNVPEIRFTSNLSGTWITDEQAIDPNYWVDHLRNSVRFADNVNTVLQDESCVLVEVGPGRTLTNLARANGANMSSSFNSMRHPHEEASDLDFALQTLGRIWANGALVNWEDYWAGEFRLRIPLPTHPFERKSYWIEPGKVSAAADSTETEIGELHRFLDVNDWFASLQWKQSQSVALNLSSEPQKILIFEDTKGLSKALADKLLADYSACLSDVVSVVEGKAFERLNDNHYAIDPLNSASFEQLFNDLGEEHAPDLILYFWSFNLDASSECEALRRETLSEGSCFWSLFNLGKALSGLDNDLTLKVVTDRLYGIAGSESLPEKSLVLGPIENIAHEYAHVSTCAIDVPEKIISKPALLNMLTREVLAKNEETHIALSGHQRWIRFIQKAEHAPSGNKKWLADGAKVLITGGLGGIGLEIAESLAKRGAKELVLMGRSKLPERSRWEKIIQGKIFADDSVLRKVRRLLDIENSGASVRLVACDVSDLEQTQNAVKPILSQLGGINGVIHAAGVMDDQLMVMKSDESAQKVLSGKVKGALILDQILSNEALDFFVIFSSVASYLGLPGQIDYTAANAFLDAFASERAERCSGITRVVNWNAWTDIGMTVDVVREQGGALPIEADQSAQDVHPLFENIEVLSNIKTLVTAEYLREKFWLISEHVTKTGYALMPGTGYIELIRAAANYHAQRNGESAFTLELSDVQFLSAFQISDNDKKVLHVLVDGDVNDMQVSVYSESDELPHASALVQVSREAETGTIELSLEKIACDKPVKTQNRFMDQSFMAFGERWACLDKVSRNESQALLEISLDKVFEHDLDIYGLHPAMLDMATGSAQFLMKSFDKETDFFVPVQYKKAYIYSSMPSKFYSRVSVREQVPQEFAEFDVLMFDDHGQVFMRVDGFVMRKVEADFLAKQLEENETGGDVNTDYLESVLRQAIRPEEGIKAFYQLMASDDEQVQWVVSSVDSKQWLRQLDVGVVDSSEHSLNISFEQEDIHDPDVDPDIAKVESVIAENEGVESVIVRSFLDENCRRRLIAYYLPDDWAQVTVTELRKFAKEALGPELAPQQLVQLGDFPSDDQGKIDRTQLLDPFAPVDNYIAPETATQKKLSKIWQSVVGVSRVGLNENFFDIGGHSLLSIRVIVKVKKEFGVRLDQAIMVLYTLEQMAQEIDTQASQQVPEQDIEANPVRDSLSDNSDVSPAVEQVKAGESTIERTETGKKRLFNSLFRKGK